MRFRAIAILTGVALIFVVLPLDFALGAESRLLWPTTWAVYAAVGAAAGFIRPNEGWRHGLCLAAPWLSLLPLMFLFSDGSPTDTSRELKELAGHLMVLVAACLGAEVGAIIKRHCIAHPSS